MAQMLEHAASAGMPAARKHRGRALAVVEHHTGKILYLLVACTLLIFSAYDYTKFAISSARRGSRINTVVPPFNCTGLNAASEAGYTQQLVDCPDRTALRIALIKSYAAKGNRREARQHCLIGLKRSKTADEARMFWSLFRQNLSDRTGEPI